MDASSNTTAIAGKGESGKEEAMACTDKTTEQRHFILFFYIVLNSSGSAV